MKFKCYAASTERYPSVREARWSNFDSALMALRTSGVSGLADSIEAALPKRAENVRIHGGGDFFSQEYFDAWLEVCRRNPHVNFWAFTKSLPYWLARDGSIPPNLVLQASYGGRHDDLIEMHGLKSARVFMSTEDAEKSGLPVDCDDELARAGTSSFALIEAGAKRRKKAAQKAAAPHEVKQQEGDAIG